MATQKELSQLLTREYLEEKYVVQDLFAADIAKEVGCSTVTITTYLRKHNIPIVKKYIKGTSNRSKADLSTITREFLEEEYLAKQKPVYILARELGTTARSLTKKMKELGFDVQNHRKHEPTTFASGLTLIGGYLAVYMPEHHRAETRGYVKLHTLIAEYFLGRLLNTDEVIHHKNLDKLDNRLCNLVLTDNKYHSTIHNYIRWGKEDKIKDMLTLQEMIELQESEDKKPQR